ncbi:hypothetical protein [Nocardia rhamnosiphila]
MTPDPGSPHGCRECPFSPLTPPLLAFDSAADPVTLRPMTSTYSAPALHPE